MLRCRHGGRKPKETQGASAQWRAARTPADRSERGPGSCWLGRVRLVPADRGLVRVPREAMVPDLFNVWR